MSGSMSTTLDPRLPGPAGPPRDRLGRASADLRISVTDRCNFRCTYCMPAEVFGRDFAFLPRDADPALEEIARLAGIFVGLGVEKLRITGGEPPVRRDLPDLVASWPRSTGVPRPHPDHQRIGAAALRRAAAPTPACTGSPSASTRSTTPSSGPMNGVDFPVARVLDGIAAARAAGLAPIKVNMVVRRGVNEASILPMARWARDDGLILRFIEYMDVGHSNGWRLDDVVPADEILAHGRRRAARSSRLPPNYRGRGGRPLPLPRRRRARSASSPR